MVQEGARAPVDSVGEIPVKQMRSQVEKDVGKISGRRTIEEVASHPIGVITTFAPSTDHGIFSIFE